MPHTFKATVWLYPGEAAWHFVTLPQDLANQIRFEQGPDFRRPMVKVEVSIHQITWKTSIFWDKRIGSFLLPLKADARKKAAIHLGDEVEVRMVLLGG